jgi:hypothetical protein
MRKAWYLTIPSDVGRDEWVRGHPRLQPWVKLRGSVGGSLGFAGEVDMELIRRHWKFMLVFTYLLGLAIVLLIGLFDQTPAVVIHE